MQLFHLSFLNLSEDLQLALSQTFPDIYNRCIDEIMDSLMEYSRIRGLKLNWGKHDVKTVNFISFE